MRIKITYNELTKRLRGIGYVEKRLTGSHLILDNEKFHSTIVLPIFNRNKLAEPYFILTVKKNIVEKGILTDEEFGELLTTKK